MEPINYNEFDIPDTPINYQLFTAIHDIEHWLDLRYREQNVPRIQKIGAAVMSGLIKMQANMPILRLFMG